jgi:hypothetical protein
MMLNIKQLMNSNASDEAKQVAAGRFKEKGDEFIRFRANMKHRCLYQKCIRKENGIISG